MLTACSSKPTLNNGSLSYDDIKGSGLANSCPQIVGTSMDSIALENGQSYSLKALCLQPETFLVKREKPMTQQGKRQAGKFVTGKLLTRKSSTLDQIDGLLQSDTNGSFTFVEQGGFDFQPVTVQLPDGERVPLLFTIKGLVANTQEAIATLSPATRLAGTFDIPPYRTSSFIDPKGRGLAMGYDAAVGIPVQADREKFSRQNNKDFGVAQGHITLQINRVNRATGEVAGQFESQQPSDTDFGSKEPMTVKIQGQFYGRVEPKIA
ncbi:MAG: photosystem II manganese-stabilizing polypeptide [Phormidesmis sp.]